MTERSEFLKDMRAAVEQLFAHRKAMRRVAVRFGFYPESLLISASVTLQSDDCHESEARREAILNASQQQMIPWDLLDTIDPAEFIAIVDRVCQPAHDVLLGKPK